LSSTLQQNIKAQYRNQEERFSRLAALDSNLTDWKPQSGFNLAAARLLLIFRVSGLAFRLQPKLPSPRAWLLLVANCFSAIFDFPDGTHLSV
jgi:hypothetical protein